MLRFQRKSAISSDTDEEEYSDYDQILDNLNVENAPMVRIFALGEINKYIRGFEDRELSNFDKTLLRGFYVKRHENPDDRFENSLSKKKVSAKEKILGSLTQLE